MRQPSRCRPSEAALRRSGGRVFGMHHLDGVVEHPLAHEVRIKLPGGSLAVMRCQLRCQRRRPVKVNPETAPRPEQELRDALQVSEVARRLRMALRQHLRREMGDSAVGLFQRQADRHSAGRGLRLLRERPGWPAPPAGMRGPAPV